MFIDATALTALLCREPGYERLADALRRAARRLTSEMVVFETVVALAQVRTIENDEAEVIVNGLLAAADVTVVLFGAEEASVARAAHARFGPGRHPARLNLGDCFTYACAKAHGTQILSAREGFAQTDIACAA